MHYFFVNSNPGTAAEFCYQYIDWCSNNKSSITAQGFLNWMDSVENETMHLVYQLIFNFALAIYVQKTGVRCNDHKLVNAGRYKFMPLFYAFNHPIYQEIEYRDLRNQISYPDEIKKLLSANISFTSSKLDHNLIEIIIEK